MMTLASPTSPGLGSGQRNVGRKQLAFFAGECIRSSGLLEVLQPPAAGIAGAQPGPQVVQARGAVGGVGRGGGQRLLIGGDGGIQVLQPPAAGIAGAQPGPQVVQD
jgi:hypothetical protein